MPLPNDLPDWARPCPTHKIKYTSAADARKQATVGTHTRKGVKSAFKGTLHIYRCHLCGSHHITSKTSRPDKKKFKKEKPMPSVEVEISRTVTVEREESSIVDHNNPKSVLDGADGPVHIWIDKQASNDDSNVSQALRGADWDVHDEGESAEYHEVTVLTEDS